MQRDRAYVLVCWWDCEKKFAENIDAFIMIILTMHSYGGVYVVINLVNILHCIVR